MEKSKKKKIGKKFGVFFVVNFCTTLVDYGFYTLTARLIGDNNYLWVASMVGGTIGTIIAYILNDRITWKSADPGKMGVIKFFVWNGLKIAAIKPVLTVFYRLFGGLYEFGFSISSAIHLPFDYNFVESTAIYVLTTATTMILSFLVYDKLIFKGEEKKDRKKKNVESVGKARKEEIGEEKTDENTEK